MEGNYQEISPEQESEILREFFPELLETSEANENMERGRSRVGSYRTRRPIMAGHSGRRSFFRRRDQWPAQRLSYSYSSDSPPAAPPQGLAWAQSCLAQVVGPWVRPTGRFDALTRRAIRMFQSRQHLRVTGALDRRTLAALHQACDQQTAPDQSADSGPAPDTLAPAAASPSQDSATGQDSAPVQDGPSDRDQSSAPDTAPDAADATQEWAGETAVAPTNGCNEDRCARDYIAWLQRSLNQLGSRLSVNGLLERNTINAINQFKQKNGIAAREYYASPVIERALVQAGVASPPAPRRLPCGVTDLKVLLPLIDKYRADIPREYLLGWITVESGGKLGDLTKICERGYFQVHPEESQRLNLDHDRLSTDPGYSVEGGVKLVKMYRSGIERLAEQLGIDKKSDLFWGLVKLRHWIPSAPQRLLAAMSANKVSISTWDSIRQYVTADPALRLGGFDPRAGIKSVDKYLTVVGRWRQRFAVGP